MGPSLIDGVNMTTPDTRKASVIQIPFHPDVRTCLMALGIICVHDFTSFS